VIIVRRLARWKRIALSRLSLHYPAFLRFLPTPRPLSVRAHHYNGPSPSRDLLVCLPGIDDEAKDFADRGFVDLVRAHGWPADVLLVDAHYGYYADRTVLEQLRRDVLLPASASGYRAVWLVGISMGGLGALLYASRHPSDVRGVVAIAPFLGRQTLVREISGAGGLAQWTATVDSTDEIGALWSWAHDHSRRSPAMPEVFLAYGDTDIFADAHRLLASSLPAANVVTSLGGHRWPVWLDLWRQFLGRHVARETGVG
jgi:pimeloyl-ACP methyl ester carboxylesterase